MCGIAGIMSFDDAPVAREDVRAMCLAMTHRGPDDEGYFVGPQIGLGMRRLSIIDLAGGHQPIANEDGSVQAVLNGEIYNYRALRRELEGRGHVFRTGSDTETIVHLYEDRGDRCVDELRGMFAFAVWDLRQRRLLVARDRLGIKPLYYSRNGNRLLFASELKALLALPELERRVGIASVDHLLTTLTTPAAESIVAGVHKLLPGHVLTASPGRELRVSRYWQVRFSPVRRPVAALEEELRTLLDESVGLHLIADVPLGAFLSGGVDSSAVVAAMVRKSARPVKTFSIGFREKEFNELGYARQVADALGTEHRELVVEPASLSAIEDIAWYLDEPFGDASAIPTYLVSQLAAKEVKVVLSGDGGDELFGGYERYLVEGRERGRFRPAWVRRLLGAISARLPPEARGKRWLRHNSLAPEERYQDACQFLGPAARSELFAPEQLRALAAGDASHAPAAEARSTGASGLHWLSRLQQLDLESYLPLDILTKVDRMSMAHSIEARVPLLDHKLVEFAATLPPELLIHRGTTKYLFKRALRGRLPEAVLQRPKRGFAVPLGRWFRGRLGEFARDLLLSDKSLQRGFFDPAAVRLLVERQGPRQELGLELWTLLSLELWCRAFLDRPARATRLRTALSQEGRPWAALGA
jgi:asparagine synthase (glutamine-hydrolysing)